MKYLALVSILLLTGCFGRPTTKGEIEFGTELCAAHEGLESIDGMTFGSNHITVNCNSGVTINAFYPYAKYQAEQVSYE